NMLAMDDVVFFSKQKTAYEVFTWLEFRRVLFRSHRLIGALGVGPVDVFGSSGGAVTGLAMVAAHPEDVRTLIAHEPPVLSLLPEIGSAALGTARERSGSPKHRKTTNIGKSGRYRA